MTRAGPRLRPAPEADGLAGQPAHVGVEADHVAFVGSGFPPVGEELQTLSTDAVHEDVGVAATPPAALEGRRNRLKRAAGE